MTVTEPVRTEQKTLRAQAREFAGDVLAHVRDVTDALPTPTERYRATRPFYRQMVEAGFLRRLVPQALGGDGTGASTTAVLAEELVAGDPSVALHLFSTGLGLTPCCGPAPRAAPAVPRPVLASTGPARIARPPPGVTASIDENDPGHGDGGGAADHGPPRRRRTGSSTGRSSGSPTRPGGRATGPTS